jgi:hypothetical protein
MTAPTQLDPYFEIQHFDDKADFWRTADFAFFDEAAARAAYQKAIAESSQPQNIRLIKLTPEILEQAETAPTEAVAESGLFDLTGFERVNPGYLNLGFSFSRILLGNKPLDQD